MKMIQKIAPVLLSAVCLVGFATQAKAAEGNEMASLAQGKVVINQNTPPNAVPSVEAKILIPRPPEKVWSVVADPVRLMSDERKVKQVKMISKSGNTQNVQFKVAMTPLFPPFDYVLEQNLSAPNMLTFHRVSGSFRDIQGFWKLTPVSHGQQTILSYMLKLDPGPLIPHGLLLNAVKSDLPNMMQSAKSAIDKNTP